MELDLGIIGRNIKTARKARQMTQEKLASAVGVNDKYISNIECGRDQASSPVYLAIANELHVGLDFLFGENLLIHQAQHAQEDPRQALLHLAQSVSDQQCPYLLLIVRSVLSMCQDTTKKEESSA